VEKVRGTPSRSVETGPGEREASSRRRAGGVDAVVEAEPAVGEEDVAADLAAEQRPLLLHLGLDEAVAGLPHDAAAAPRRDVVVERGRALHLADDGRAGVLGEHGPREEDHELVAPEDVPLLVHGAEPVGVAVVGHAQVGAGLGTFAFRCVEVALHRGVGVVVGKRPSISMKSGTTSTPQRAEDGTATTPPVPLPASTTTLSLRGPRRRFWRTYSW
jgi:hypothetical protein